MVEVDDPRRKGLFVVGGQRPRNSLERRISDVRTRCFPTKQDLLRLLVDAGEVEDEADLLANRPELVSELMLSWIGYGQTGCHFATKLARSPAESGLLSVAYLDSPSEAMVESFEALLLDAPAAFEAVQFILPRVQSPEDAIQLLSNLGAHPRWYTTSIPNEQGDEDLVGLRWRLPGGRYVSWVLGFAPLETMPFTRRAPYTALFMRMKAPEFHDPDRPTEDDLLAVHLADVPHRLSSESLLQKWWRNTRQTKTELLAGELTSAARARVTFSLPPGSALALVEL